MCTRPRWRRWPRHREVVEAALERLPGYGFGPPVIVTYVGSLRDDVVEAQTGLVWRPADPEDLARWTLDYFRSDMFRSLPARRNEIGTFAQEAVHSCHTVGRIPREICAQLSPDAPSDIAGANCHSP